MFERLNSKILAVLREEGIKAPTPPQKEVFELILSGKNVLLIAPTGTGKTEAALLPIFQKFLESAPKPISCLYITPLRALNRDLNERLTRYSKALNIRIGVRHGDTPVNIRKKQSIDPPDLLITTPETLQILLTAKKLRTFLKNIKYVVIDEIHELVQDERGAQLAVALERLTQLAGEYQRIALSAVVGNSAELGAFIAGMRDIVIKEVAVPKSIDVSLSTNTKKYDKESELMGCEPEYGAVLMEILEILKTHKESLIFVNTRTTAEDMAMRYTQLNTTIPISVHHGSLSREIRQVNEEKLRAGSLLGLICTTSLELGIDIGTIDFVIQYNSPRQVYRLLQRVGRSGHTLTGISQGMIISENVIELEEGLSIIDLAKRGIVEKLKIRKNPIVVLANQVIATAYAEKKVHVFEYFRLLRKTYIFRNLSEIQYLSVLKFLKSLWLIWLEGEYFGTTRRALTYFYQNISLIPDIKSYIVIIRSTRTAIGVLDERFVMSYLDIGRTFVMKGTTWRVVEITESKIFVEKIQEISVPPLWVGEEIPVSYIVAMNVTKFRDLGTIPEYVSGGAKNKLLRWWKSVPAKNKTITLEKKEKLIVIEDYFGTKVNLTLAELFSAVLAQKLGESINISYSPYHIAFETESNIDIKELKHLMDTINPEHVEVLLRKSIRHSKFFKIVFYYVAKKFGIIKKDADFRAIRLDKLIDIYRNTVVFEESINKVFADYFDIEHAREIMYMIQTHQLTVKIVPFSKASQYIITRYSENFAPIKLTKVIVEKVYERLLNEEINLFCLSCHRTYSIKVHDLDKVRCPYCDSVKITMFQRYERDKKQIFEKYDLTPAEELERKKFLEISRLLRVYKKVGALTLIGRGVGLTTARRILRHYSGDNLALVREILENEIQYAKTRRFWD